METKLAKISEIIGPDCAGIIWLSSEALSYNIPMSYEFNYLLNGLLGQAINYHQIQEARPSLFLSHNFGKPFFISHFKFDKDKTAKAIEEQLKIISTNLADNKKIYIYSSQTDFKIESIIKKINSHFKQFEVIELNI